MKFPFNYLSSGRLWEVKNKGKIQTFSSKSGRRSPFRARVEGKWSRVTSRGSKNSSQLFLNVVKSKFRVYLSFRFLFYFTLTPSDHVSFFSGSP